MPESPRTRFTQSRIVSVTTSDSGKLAAQKKGKRKPKRKGRERHELYHRTDYAWCHCGRWYRTPINSVDAETAFQQHLAERGNPVA
jgi:recombinational DNA repair protein (RecF pathway)